MPQAQAVHSTADSTCAPGRARPRTTVLEALERAVAAGGDDDFLEFTGTRYTFREVDRLSTRFAHALAALGVTQGQTVSTVLDNNLDQVVCWFAVNKLGAIWVPLNTAYRGEFLRHQLADSCAEVVVCESDYLPNVLGVLGGATEVRTILCRGDLPCVEPPVGVRVEPLEAHRGTDETPLPFTARPEDLALLIYTSGTTGPSKGCMISHNYICHQAAQTNLAIPPIDGDVLYTCLPLFHVSAIDTLVSALLAHLRIAIAPRFSVSTFWSEIEQSGATNARLMSAIFPLLASAPDDPAMRRCFGQIRAVSGSPITPEVRKIWSDRFGVPFLNNYAYGQTEGVRLSMSRIGDTDTPEDSVGRIDTEAFDVVVLDDDDNTLPDGEIGEIAFRPRLPHVMFDGYWRRPEDTTEAWRNLWMHTGDLGRVVGGFLYFVDRKKDYLRNRGENISSFEVERAILRHPDIVEAAAHPAGNGIAEGTLKITAVLADGSQCTEEALCRWAVDHLPHFAVPRYIEFRDRLPKTPTNKVQKFRLRDEGVTATTWDRELSTIEVRRRR
ncbi:AMP-binding protein [Streptomyces sp. NPDC058001]|uniref:AMP-binding protein n=1 Tax=Streptomyces sp. NPDC058001 TaxID=3346300 RepID=UPI0036E0A08E